ncbi:MAG: protein translocase subunit SecD [Chthoniobacteraceae bacterium]
MSPTFIFIAGIGLLALFGWYLFTDQERLKRILGSLLTVLLVALCLASLNPPSERVQLGLDLKGGTSFLVRLVQEEVEITGPDGQVTMEKRIITPSMVDQAVEVIRKRVDSLGTSEPVIAPSGEDRIIVQIPGLAPEKLQDTREQLQKVAKLEFRKVHPQSSGIVAGAVPPDPGYVRLPHVEMEDGQPVDRGEIIVRKKPDLEGKHVARAGTSFEAKGWIVHLLFDREGADIFGKLTTEVHNDRSALAIILDGKVISAPGVNDGPILGGRCEISGSFDERSARNLASSLENPLQTPVAIEEERSTSPSLGADSINSGVKSGLYGVILTLIAVLLYYRFAGLVANIALTANVVILFGAMGMFSSVLTLPGIAGIILTLGMAIDANVLIYERLREEMAEGKSLKASIAAAYDKAFSAIFDSNITTLITAGLLFWKATGPVKGFAVTLTLGIIASLFTALVLTRNLFEWSIRLGWLKKITMSNLIKPTKIDFLGKRRVAITGSLTIIGLAFGIFAWHGEANFGVDFRGGDRLVLLAKNKPTDGEVRAAVDTLKIGDVVVQTEKSASTEFTVIRSPKATGTAIADHLTKTMPEAGFKKEQLESVGALVGKELATNSLVALGLGMLGILLYVSVRFELSFAVGALVALLHDVIITIGVFSLMGRELSLVIIGAILTIAGYSVNDTIVVFDRIRENIKARRRGSIAEIMNLAINETLSRTVLTGGVTLLTTLILFMFGGPVLADFALTILIGVLVGTYSSIFVAAPIVLWWSRKSGADLAEEIRRGDAPDEVIA